MSLEAGLTLSDLARGDATAQEARGLIEAATSSSAARGRTAVYEALLAWVWRMLGDRIDRQDLKAWHSVIKQAGARLRHDTLVSTKISVLAELVYLSVLAREVLTPDEALRRRHVRMLLDVLNQAGDVAVDRADLAEKLNLKQANLTRVLNIASAAGLITREYEGKGCKISLRDADLKSLRSVDNEKFIRVYWDGVRKTFDSSNVLNATDQDAYRDDVIKISMEQPESDERRNFWAKKLSATALKLNYYDSHEEASRVMQIYRKPRDGSEPSQHAYVKAGHSVFDVAKIRTRPLVQKPTYERVA